MPWQCGSAPGGSEECWVEAGMRKRGKSFVVFSVLGTGDARASLARQELQTEVTHLTPRLCREPGCRGCQSPGGLNHFSENPALAGCGGAHL